MSIATLPPEKAEGPGDRPKGKGKTGGFELSSDGTASRPPCPVYRLRPSLFLVNLSGRARKTTRYRRPDQPCAGKLSLAGNNPKPCAWLYCSTPHHHPVDEVLCGISPQKPVVLSRRNLGRSPRVTRRYSLAGLANSIRRHPGAGIYPITRPKGPLIDPPLALPIRASRVKWAGRGNMLLQIMQSLS